MIPLAQHMFYKIPLKFAAYVVVSCADGATTGTDNSRHILALLKAKKVYFYKTREEENKEKEERKVINWRFLIEHYIVMCSSFSNGSFPRYEKCMLFLQTYPTLSFVLRKISSIMQNVKSCTEWSQWYLKKEITASPALWSLTHRSQNWRDFVMILTNSSQRAGCMSSSTCHSLTMHLRVLGSQL